MPNFTKGVRPIVYPGGAFRTSAQVARMNDEHSSERLPTHETLVIEHPSGNGYDALVAEIEKYNKISPEEIEVFVTRLLIEPAMSRPNDRAYEANILGVRARLVKTV